MKRPVLLVTCIVISIAMVFAVGYLLESQPAIWIIRFIASILAVVFLSFLIYLGYSYEWTGFGQEELPEPKDDSKKVRPKKTVWDWMDLLIVPFMLALVTVAFTWFQDNRQTQIEEQRAQSERQIEEQRAQDAALQDYLGQMSTLLIKNGLLSSGENSEVRTVARARTATVIQRLDSEGNRNVITFLNEAGLTGVGQSPFSLLAEVDLEGAQLRNVVLGGTDLYGGVLSEADLRGALLDQANLNYAFLIKADLRGAYLNETKLEGAFLDNADLRGAYLKETNFEGTELDGANLEGAYYVDEKKLNKQAETLEGAIMPDGSKHP
jgi:uncharacterized protein YjbI with pentapeptide repeats